MSGISEANETFQTENDIYPYENLSINIASISEACTISEITSLSDFVNLFGDEYCRRHSVGFTAFLCVANLLILICGFVGNSMVIYVVTCKFKTKTVSSWFILNLAVADLLVILFCIPATLVANIFTPWIFGDTMCKSLPYAQGVSVFCSVYSLVAISFDRSRAIHHSTGLRQNISSSPTPKIVCLIWLIGVAITLPWAFVFKLVYLSPDEFTGTSNNLLPFCHETWNTKSQEVFYFLFTHVFACFLLPLGLIVACNVITWWNISGICQNSAECENRMNEMHRRRRLRVLKMFTFLTFLFFICWLPLYLIVARVKFYYNDQFSGHLWEKKLIVTLIPIAQLLGSCNSCVNPILYALLNQKFRESFKSILCCPLFCKVPPPTISVVSRGKNCTVTVVASGLGIQDTHV